MIEGGALLVPGTPFGQEFNFKVKFVPLFHPTEKGKPILAEETEFSYLAHWRSFLQPRLIFGYYDSYFLHFNNLPSATQDIKLAGSVIRVPFDDIVYLESKGRKIIFVTKSRTYESYGALSQFAEQLPSGGFIFSHKSFVVNLNHVSKIMKTDFITDTGQAIPISKSCYPEAKTAFINFIGKDKF